MKTFLKILAGILIVIILAAVGLNLYFTDERLKRTVMPYMDESIGREVQVESMSLTFFSTFPQPGLSIRKLSVPGETANDTLVSLDEFVIGVKLFPLLGNEISISEIKLNKPRFTYRISEDGSSNLDFLTAEAAEDTAAADEATAYSVSVPYFTISNARFGYEDATSKTNVTFDDFNADISLEYADLIQSTIEIKLGGLYASVEGSNYVNGLPLSLSETSTIDMENETIHLEEGTLSIRGLALNLTGSISNWSAEAPKIDLVFNTSSDNFGELLRLVPAEYEDQIKGLETRGALAISGNVKGALGDQPPAFNADISVTDGYLKNPDLPRAIEKINLRATISNDLLTVERLDAVAGPNRFSATGTLERPLAEDGSFDMNITADMNLATVNEFYDLSEFDIEELGGKLDLKASSSGNMDRPEEARFNADLSLTNGLLKYAEVTKAIEEINVEAEATQKLVTLNSFSLTAAQNRFSMNGTISNPMDENSRSVDLETDLFFDLASIKEFYPIDEDTLTISGELTANAVLKGQADQIEKAIQQGSIDLKNGFIDYKRVGKPIRDITLKSTLRGNRISISRGSFETGDNSLSISGSVTEYLGDNPILDLQIKGNTQFAEVQNYYDLKPAISSLTGTGTMDLSVKGAVQDPASFKLDGSLNVNSLNMEGDSLVQPVHNLNGELVLTPQAVTLKSLAFDLGSSDLNLSGSLNNYMQYLHAEPDRTTTPRLSGTFSSRLFNMDELIDWEDTTTTAEPILIELPDLNSSVTAGIDELIVTGITMRNLRAGASTTPKQIKLDRASVELFDGKASGSFTWKVPRPDRTNIAFSGSLDSLRANAFFREYPVLGENSEFHKYISGAFSSEVQYYSELNEMLEPDIKTTKMNGNFRMTKARLKGHPLQAKLAALFKSDDLNNIAIDEMNTIFNAENSIFTIKDLKLTSGDIGVNMSGTQHLITEKIDYKMNVFLPDKYKDKVASVISQRAADALTQENGTILVPLRITGTQQKPVVTPDQEAIKPILKEFLKDKAGNALKKLFGDG